MIALVLTVNGERVETDVEPRMSLADLLRERLDLTGTHLGCEQGACGACTVMLNGAPARSCLTFAVSCRDFDVRSIEGFDDDPLMARLRDAFSHEHALQCGFCTPGMLISSRDIVTRLPGADEARIREELSGNLCRCTGYLGIVRAVARVAAEQASAPVSPIAPPRRAPRTFVAEATEAEPPPHPALADGSRMVEGWNRLSERFTLPRPVDEVWALFADLPRMASCIPGASLDAFDGHSLTGRIRVQLGPIRAAFAGRATLERDDLRKRGVLSGAGGDEGGSRARGRVIYALAAEGDAHTGVDLTLEFILQGALAQFARSGLVGDFAAHLVRQFAANLAEASDGAQTPATRPMRVGGMFWSAVRAWIRSWFGKS